MYRSVRNRSLTRRSMVGAAAVAGLGSVAGMGAASASLKSPLSARMQDEPKSGGNLIMALPVDVVNYDPFLVAGTHGYALARGVYNTLTRYDENLEPQPELATDWQFSEDGTQLTLNLREGVTYHSGREFTGEDVVFSLEAAQDPDYAALIRALVLPISAEATDTHTVVLTTEEPYAAIFDALDGLFIVDRETAEPQFPEAAIGTGPFTPGERVPGDYVRFDRYDDYWDGPAHLDSFELRPTPDLAAMAVALEAGTVDVAWRLNYRDYVRLDESDEFAMSPGAPAALYYDVIMDTNHPVLSDNRVRQAINWAIDRDRFVDVVLRNIVGPTSIPYPEASIAYDAELANRYSKDLDRAAELLAEAGYADGFEATIMTSTQRNPGMIELAQILQADLDTIGVTLEIEDLEPTVYDPRFLDGDFDLAVHTFGRANKDPATLFNGAVVWYTDPETNPSGFQSDRYAELVAEGSTTIDPDQRREIYGELTELILEESWCIPVAEQPRVWGMKSDVRDFVYTADNMPLWHKVWLDR